VVPTISLAQDQTKAAKTWFSRARMQPAALTGFTSQEEKRKLYQGVREGSLPILYTSPESLLMNSWLYDACQQSAAAGKLTRFVIDEAHLVDTWGAEFRPEFQLMGAFCAQLRKRTNGQMITLLLSATVTSETEQVLRQTFTPDGELQTVIGNHLRPEPSYWFSHVSSKEEQQYRVLDALNHLPRPAILYVTLKKDANEWRNVLDRHGYKRVAVYTGDTTGVERERILDEWRSNQIDIMIGNSAFGVGVDKPDIRTVIHATAPDNMDRFYQEVGRGGRDGNSSISLVVTKDVDFRQARQNRAKLIGEEIGWARWQGMWRAREGVSGEEFILSMTVPPIDKPIMGNNTKNRQWNQRTLLLLQRCGLLIIDDSSPKRIEKENEPRQGNSDEELYVQVRICDEKALTDQGRFKVTVAEQRRVELDAANQQINMFAKTVQQAAKGKMRRCVGRSLATLYPFSTYLCGGCPVCRENNDIPSTKKDIRLHLEIETITHRYEISRNLEAAFRNRHIALALCADNTPKDWLGRLIPLLVNNGIEQIVTPELTGSVNLSGFDEMYTTLGRPDLRYTRHRLVTSTTLLNGQDELFGLPTAVFYSGENDQIDRLFGFITREFDLFELPYPILHVIPRNAELQSLGGLMRDKVNGTRLDIDDLIDQLSPKQSQIFYR
jgi:ATP-dependent DNA helicase RecQ